MLLKTKVLLAISIASGLLVGPASAQLLKTQDVDVVLVDGAKPVLNSPFLVKARARRSGLRVLGIQGDGLFQFGEAAGDDQFRIRYSMSAGAHQLWALVADDKGRVYSSEPLSIYVEPIEPVEVVEIFFDSRSAPLDFPGDSAELALYANTASERGVSIAGSRSLVVGSSNERVAIVENGERIRATGPGQAIVTAGFLGRTASIAVTVTGPQKGDFDADGDVDSRDILRWEMDMGQPTIGAGDARDLNEDGKISNPDRVLIRKACTRPKCADR